MDVMGWDHLRAPDLTGRTAVVTGAGDGIGREAALRLALWGARVVLPVRTRAKGERTAARIRRETGRAEAATLVDVDLADLASVRRAAVAVRELVDPPTDTSPGGIDLLVHVAGAVTRGRRETGDGLETMTAVNAVAPLLLTELLLPVVTGRVVLTTSGAHTAGRLERDGDRLTGDVGFARGGWSLPAAYGRSKLLAMLGGRELSDRLRDAGSAVDVQLVHPGWVLTNLQNATGSPVLDRVVTALCRPIAMTAVRGADAVLFSATQPLPPGSYVGPDGPGALRGRPTLLPRSAAAADPRLAAAATAWMRERAGLA